jgi:2-keto-4-pentenoate hydratase/2-oxohepta-3-ene-1,7-dioic acid hydratase in catechol pathway
MRIANVDNRLTLITEAGAGLDVETASGGRFASDPQSVYDVWPDFLGWAAELSLDGAKPFSPKLLGSPSPRPRQVFAIGLNYGDHIAEAKAESSARPPVFTKFATSITGPYAEVEHPGGELDWEVELVVVIGRGGHHVDRDQAWGHVAGLTIGQDLSERVLQHAGYMPQYSLGKSYPGFGPMGPYLVTPDEFDDPDDLELGCSVNGESVQQSRTSMLLTPVADLIAQLSSVTPLLPGDVIFTGTPAGVGFGRSPQRYLSVGDEVTSHIAGIGEMRTLIVAPPARG